MAESKTIAESARSKTHKRAASSSRAASCKSYRDAQAEKDYDGVRHLRSDRAAAYLGICKSALNNKADAEADQVRARTMRADDCKFPFHREIVAGRSTRYFSFPHLEAERESRLSAGHLVRDEVGEVKTIAEIEKEGKWICDETVGKHLAVYWRMKGWLTKADKRRFLVRLQYKSKVVVKEVWFSKSSKVDQLPGSFSRSASSSAYRDGQAEKWYDGIRHLRSDRAAAYLGISKSTLRYKADAETEQVRAGTISPSDRKFPFHSEIVAGLPTRYFSFPHLKTERASQKRAGKLGPGEVTEAVASKITGLSRWTLRDEEWCTENGIVQIKYQKYRPLKARAFGYKFKKVGLVAYADREPPVPVGRMTASEAANILKCSTTVVKQLCHSKVLDAIFERVPGWERSRWLPTEESVERVWKQTVIPRSRMRPIAAAKMLGCSKQTVMRLCKIGVLDWTPSTSPIGYDEPWITKKSVKAARKILRKSRQTRGRWQKVSRFPSPQSPAVDNEQAELAVTPLSSTTPNTAKPVGENGANDQQRKDPVGQVEWDASDVEYFSSSQICKLFAWRYSEVTRVCRPGGPVSYMRKGQRLRVHFRQFAQYVDNRGY